MKKVVSSKACLACRGCCVFDEDEDIAPCFSPKEVADLDKSFFLKKGKLIHQAKTKNSKKYQNKKICIFLDENSHRCGIYSKRPLECRMWPLVLGNNKSGKGICLSVAKNYVCPAVKGIDKKELELWARSVFKKIDKDGVIDEIKKGERFLWPFFEYQSKLVDIDKNFKIKK